MAPDAEIYVAGAGFAPLPRGKGTTGQIIASLVSATTKALLDAGLTFDDVTQGVWSSKDKKTNVELETFKAFDEQEIPLCEAKHGSELGASAEKIKNEKAQCVLVVARDNAGAFAFVVISDNFLWRHPYLKESAVVVRTVDHRDSKSSCDANERLKRICDIVWSLRGWSLSQHPSQSDGTLHYEEASSTTYELCRADGRAVPKWEEIKHRQDGKYRLGHNPAAETKNISLEDFEAVKAYGQTTHEGKTLATFERKGGDRAALAKL